MQIKKLDYPEDSYEINATNGWWISFELACVDYCDLDSVPVEFMANDVIAHQIYDELNHSLISNMIGSPMHERASVYKIIKILVGKRPIKCTRRIVLPDRSINRLVHKAKRNMDNEEWRKFYTIFAKKKEHIK